MAGALEDVEICCCVGERALLPGYFFYIDLMYTSAASQKSKAPDKHISIKTKRAGV